MSATKRTAADLSEAVLLKNKLLDSPVAPAVAERGHPIKRRKATKSDAGAGPKAQPFAPRALAAERDDAARAVAEARAALDALARALGDGEANAAAEVELEPAAAATTLVPDLGHEDYDEVFENVDLTGLGDDGEDAKAAYLETLHAEVAELVVKQRIIAALVARGADAGDAARQATEQLAAAAAAAVDDDDAPRMRRALAAFLARRGAAAPARADAAVEVVAPAAPAAAAGLGVVVARVDEASLCVDGACVMGEATVRVVAPGEATALREARAVPALVRARFVGTGRRCQLVKVELAYDAQALA